MVNGGTQFDHVILTRFSVRFTADQPPADEDWLAYRWGFFRDALASSLSRQTEKAFTWLVFFDSSAPEWLREEVAALSPGLFHPVWLDEPWGHAPLRRAVDEHSSQDWLITTRIDSDDAVARRFVEDLQSRFAGQESMYVNFLHGLQVVRTGELYRYWKPVNSFISYIERRDATPPRTVFQDFRHRQSNTIAPVLNVVGEPRWMQVVHGGNVANSVRGHRISPRGAGQAFDLDLPFRTHVSRGRLTMESGVSILRLLGLWARHPRLFLEQAEAVRLRLRGTTISAQRAHASTRY